MEEKKFITEQGWEVHGIEMEQVASVLGVAHDDKDGTDAPNMLLQKRKVKFALGDGDSSE